MVDVKTAEDALKAAAALIAGALSIMKFISYVDKMREAEDT